MLTVVIPTLDSEKTVVATFVSLIPAAVDGMVSQVVVADGGSADATLQIADGLGCDIVAAPGGRGSQLCAGARAARHGWLLFLHSDTVLDDGWHREAMAFVERQSAGTGPVRAAAFRFALDDSGAPARFLERVVALRSWMLGLPYGDQGLLISRAHYERIGGFRDLPLMEDVDIVRRIGRRRLAHLRARAVTSAERYRRDGYLRRMLRNAGCLTLYFLRVPPRVLVRLYG